MKIVKIITVFLGLFLVLPNLVNAQETKFIKATVVELISEDVQEFFGDQEIMQTVRLRLSDNTEIEIEHSELLSISKSKKLEVGQMVVVQQIMEDGEITNVIIDQYRISSYYWLVGLFLIIVFVVGRSQGVRAILGLAVSILVIGGWIIPKIIMGSNPLLVVMIGSLFIASFSIYIAHGFNKRVTVAVISTVITLFLSFGLAVLFVYLAKLTGLGSEDAFYLQLSPLHQVNLRGLLLGGIIIGALGVLDDVTTAQTAAVDEIKKANSSLTWKELYQRGLSVGKEHISSMLNTLALAYIGASFPLLLLFFLDQERPWWVIFNSEFMAEEIVRTLVGSMALILAVPISTFLAARYMAIKNY